jgi:transcriptional regulator GlxA family with amidase domain
MGGIDLMAGRASTDTTWEKVDEFKKEYPEVQPDELFLREGEILSTRL